MEGSVTLIPAARPPDDPLERAFERLGEVHELLHVIDKDGRTLDDPLLDSRLGSLRRSLVAAGDRLAQLRVNARMQGTWLDPRATVDPSAEA